MKAGTIALVLFVSAPAHAAVVDAAAGGFTVRHAIEVRGIRAPP